MWSLDEDALVSHENSASPAGLKAVVQPCHAVATGHDGTPTRRLDSVLERLKPSKRYRSRF